MAKCKDSAVRLHYGHESYKGSPSCGEVRRSPRPRTMPPTQVVRHKLSGYSWHLSHSPCPQVVLLTKRDRETLRDNNGASVIVALTAYVDTESYDN